MPPADRSRSPKDTRDSLLAAGLRLFGHGGLAGVTTRSLAEAAGVNQAAIPYHFGGKEGLYLAVAQHIADTTGAAMREVASTSLAAPPPRSRKVAAERTGELMASVLAIILHQPDAPARGGFILREQLEPTDAFEILYEQFMRPIHEALTTHVALALGTAPTDPEAILRAHAIFGQGLGFAIAREALRRRLSEASVGASTPPAPDVVTAIVAEQTTAALSALARTS